MYTTLYTKSIHHYVHYIVPKINTPLCTLHCTQNQDTTMYTTLYPKSIHHYVHYIVPKINTPLCTLHCTQNQYTTMYTTLYTKSIHHYVHYIVYKINTPLCTLHCTQNQYTTMYTTLYTKSIHHYTPLPVVSGKLENRPTAPMHVAEGDWNRNRASRDLRLETRSPPHLPTGPEGHSALKGFQPK